MELDLTWALWALPIAFVGGWVASRFDIRQWRMETRSAPKSYFKGLNYLLNEQQDQAIDAFIEAVQQDPDTTDLHFALGNLFRTRGDYDRAVRVHQHLLQRADLSRSDHERAQHALAQDFTRAGLLDRAEASLHLLLGTPYESEAQMTLLSLYERTSDWAKAIEVASQLETANRGSFKSRIAHYLCEMAQESRHQDRVGDAHAQLQQALSHHPESARARIDLSKLMASEGRHGEACAQLETLCRQVPSALPLAASQLAELARTTGRENEALHLLQEAQAQRPSIDLVDALAALMPAHDTAAQSALYLEHLRREPSLVAATRWLGLQASASERQGAPDTPVQPMPPDVQKALAEAAKPLQRYRCAACGFEAGIHFWQCPGCQTWDSYSPRRVEEL